MPTTMTTTKKNAEGSRRTSLDLPLPLWRRVKVRAIEENGGLGALLIRAIEQYLGTPTKAKP